MKRIGILTILLLTITISYGQVQWIKNYDVARAQAMAENKFIVMDFWAIWCGPCKKMDVDMWNTTEMTAYADKFIFLKIDVDSNRDIAMKYSANTIPKVVIMDASGQEIWEEIGFASASMYLKVFEDFPSELAPTEQIAKLIQKNADANTYFSLGAWYQESSKNTESVSLKKDILNLSDSYFKQAAKESKTDALATEAEFNVILNHAYRGAYKKAMKKVDKMEEAEMKNFIMAYCYKCEGQTQKMREFMDKITSKELLAQLD
ncbi:thioredoxin family protein [Ekhidna sp.]|uniref:thioredoxin family protein n=1 Tax=Ekhidna sp. TaxID=2608089 RepID=UPI0032984968